MSRPKMRDRRAALDADSLASQQLRQRRPPISNRRDADDYRSDLSDASASRRHRTGAEKPAAQPQRQERSPASDRRDERSRSDHAEAAPSRRKTVVADVADARHVRQRRSPAPERRKAAGSGSASSEVGKEREDFQSLIDTLDAQGAGVAKGVVQQIYDNAVVGPDKMDGAKLFSELSFLKNMKPRDAFEARQLLQILEIDAALHRATQNFPGAETLVEWEAVGRIVNQLARTFTGQIDTFRRHRKEAEPSVMVRNVSVAEGGQAIVGNVTQARAEAVSSENRHTQPALTYSQQMPMDIIAEPVRTPVSAGAKAKTEGGRRRFQFEDEVDGSLRRRENR